MEEPKALILRSVPAALWLSRDWAQSCEWYQANLTQQSDRFSGELLGG